MMVLRQDHRHPCVDLAHQFVWLARDYRASTEPLLAPGRFPAFPQSSENERPAITHLNRVRNFSAEHLLPFVETIGGNQASTLFERAAIRWSGIDGLNPCVDCLVSNFLILRPRWDQAPPEYIQGTLPGGGVKPDRENILSRCNVVADWQIELRRNRDVIAPGELLVGRCSSVATAHYGSLACSRFKRTSTHH